MGMEVEVPVWVICNTKKTRFINPKSKQVEKEMTEKCIIRSPDEAIILLRDMDPGFVIMTAKHLVGVNTSKIWGLKPFSGRKI